MRKKGGLGLSKAAKWQTRSPLPSKSLKTGAGTLREQHHPSGGRWRGEGEKTKQKDYASSSSSASSCHSLPDLLPVVLEPRWDTGTSWGETAALEGVRGKSISMAAAPRAGLPGPKGVLGLRLAVLGDSVRLSGPRVLPQGSSLGFG